MIILVIFLSLLGLGAAIYQAPPPSITVYCCSDKQAKVTNGPCKTLSFDCGYTHTISCVGGVFKCSGGIIGNLDGLCATGNKLSCR